MPESIPTKQSNNLILRKGHTKIYHPELLVVLLFNRRRAAAVFLGFIQQLNLASKQFVLQVQVLKLQLFALLHFRLTDIAVVQAALDDHTGGGQGSLALVTEFFLGLG